MLNRLKNALSRLRSSLSSKAEDAYKDRDAAKDDSQAEAFASGEAHAYSVAEGEVRDEQRNE